FKVPSLRNAELTFPYMHDGRFRTLEQVMDHYRFSVKESATLDPLLKNNTTPGIVLTDEESDKIIAFIKTLTDKDFIKDKKFANPF
ncbi:MAG: cytochrome-c peroxidase, partial [Cyclobacteriaceae bacterium]|nr:cytochrome-c peroxidase [Cyclobacteriaceae bacterium]